MLTKMDKYGKLSLVEKSSMLLLNRGGMTMTNNKEICKLRDKLQDLILIGADYDEICRVSQELDELIVKYYAMA